ncbi:MULTISPECIES: nuclear transport factor 2 family protein [unclassified Actinomadura]|uniref:nuclear transport factor 2 family protein n=1 Tax=unclassified Actinomadura TaxID=2626254 RepID=UPI0011F08E64|nr:nuclear transport factor 2 family protein [Actinomadura sp. K4S16]
MQATPREMFQRMQQRWLGHPTTFIGDLLADDVVIETPFAPLGRPTRFEGRQRFLEFAEPQRAALPVRFDACRTLAVHDTADPNTIVVEYELTGTNTTTSKQSTATFIGVLTIRDAQITLWREYQNTLAIIQALT